MRAISWRWLGALAASSLAAACSALIDPDPSRLGDPDEDGGGQTVRDGGGRADGGRIDGGRTDGGGTDGGAIDGGDAGCVPSCVDGVVDTCDGVERCDIACAPDGAARCGELIPSNVDPALWQTGARSLRITGVTTFDTSDCDTSAAATQIVVQSGGGEVCVLVVRDVVVESGGTLVLRGTRPLVIMASGDVRIMRGGAIDASAYSVQPGPGGGAGGTVGFAGAQPGGGGPAGGAPGMELGRYSDGGGGGGGFCGASRFHGRCP